MSVKINHGNDIYKVDLAEGTDAFAVSVNDIAKAVSVNKSADGSSFKINSNGKILTAYRAEDRDKIYVQVEAEIFVFDKKQLKKYGSMASAEAGTEQVQAPMPGSVISVKVSTGDSVEEGSPLVIVEAMKMETTLYSSISGVVKEVNVRSGEQISADTVLVVIEKE